MSKSLFTIKVFNLLKKNKHITFISEKSISFTPEFKI